MQVINVWRTSAVARDEGAQRGLMQWRESRGSGKGALFGYAGVTLPTKQDHTGNPKSRLTSCGVMAERGSVWERRCPRGSSASAAQRVQGFPKYKPRLRQERLRCCVGIPDPQLKLVDFWFGKSEGSWSTEDFQK